MNLLPGLQLSSVRVLHLQVGVALMVISVSVLRRGGHGSPGSRIIFRISVGVPRGVPVSPGVFTIGVGEKAIIGLGVKQLFG